MPAQTIAKGIFSHTERDYASFAGTIISAKNCPEFDFTGLKVALIGANAHSVKHLAQLVQQAEFVKVFQQQPHFVLPEQSKQPHAFFLQPQRLSALPLKGFRLQHWMAQRYLKQQIKDKWIQRQLLPQHANEHTPIYYGDLYYCALNRANCKLITWPIVKLHAQAVQSMEGILHMVDVIVRCDDN